MASLYIHNVADIDYSLLSGRVWYFKLGDRVLFDEDAGISEPTWRAELCAMVVEYGLDQDDGRGLHAFVAPLLADLPTGIH